MSATPAYSTTNYSAVAEDRTRDQWTAEILLHPAGEPGAVYVAPVVARFRANTLDTLAAEVADFARDQREPVRSDD